MVTAPEQHLRRRQSHHRFGVGQQRGDIGGSRCTQCRDGAPIAEHRLRRPQGRGQRGRVGLGRDLQRIDLVQNARERIAFLIRRDEGG